MTLLSVRDLHAAYGAIRVLHGIDLEVDEGEVVAILGPNGAGKTTTLRALTGGVSATGSITFDGHELVGRSTEKVVQLGIAHVPQGRGTFVGFTTEENLLLGAQLRRDRDEIAADMQRVFGYFPVLEERRRQAAGKLSGGEQQMLAVARALMLRPRLLLLDEPSLGLAPMVTRELFRIIEAINRDEATAVLVVEQNARLALEHAHRGYVLEHGSIATAGDAGALHDNPEVAEAYLGY